jgi:hypothetical protein
MFEQALLLSDAQRFSEIWRVGQAKRCRVTGECWPKKCMVRPVRARVRDIAMTIPVA